VTQNTLSIENLRTYFYIPEGVVRAVDNVSFSVGKGRTLGVLGESGCGKSVTALSAMRLIAQPPGKIVSGRIMFKGDDLLGISDAKMRQMRGNRMAMIFQEPMTSLNPVYTVGNQIAEAYEIHQNLSGTEALEKAAEMLDLVGIPSPQKRLHEYPHQLSGGMRQRTMIAMALACGPDLLFADEPTTALDVTIQAQILDLMLDLQEKLGMAIIMITHDLGVIADVSDEVVVMYAGQVMESITIDQLFTDSRHPYTQGLMASVPKLGQKFELGKQKLSEIPGMVPSLINRPRGCTFEPRCTHSTEKCRQEKPPVFGLAEDHQVRCWLVENEAVEEA
jgi:oligopeptide/dipeptide ABC transporter ATP-binding protein